MIRFETVMAGVVFFAVGAGCLLAWKFPPPRSCHDYADIAREYVPARCFRDFVGTDGGGQ